MGIFRNPAVIITLILLVVLLFGAKRLPDVARSVGSSLKIFKKEVKELADDDTSAPEGRGSSTAQDGGASSTDDAPAQRSTATNGAGGGAAVNEPTSPQGPVDPKNT